VNTIPSKQRTKQKKKECQKRDTSAKEPISKTQGERKERKKIIKNKTAARKITFYVLIELPFRFRQRRRQDRKASGNHFFNQVCLGIHRHKERGKKTKESFDNERKELGREEKLMFEEEGEPISSSLTGIKKLFHKKENEK